MKVGTFFSGVGSPEQALRNLDIKHEIEFACDIDKYAKETYLKNFKPKLFAEDITSLDMQDLPYVDLLVFGFPCQAFSMAGKRKGFDDTRGTLFYDALRYLKEHKPRYFIAENVKGLLSHDKGKTFGTIIDCLAKTTNYQMSLMPFDNLGYHIHYKVLNTKDFGLPQNRERIFIIGIRDDEDNNFNFPKEILLELKLKDILQDTPNSKYYLSDKMIKGMKKTKFYTYANIVQKGDVSSSLLASDYKLPKCVEVDEKYYLSDKAIAKIKRHNNKSLDNDLSNCIHTGYYKQGGRDQQYIKVDEKYYLSEEQQKRLLERTEVDIKNVDEPTCLDVYNKKLVKDTSICLTEPHHNNLRLVSHSLYPRISKTNRVIEKIGKINNSQSGAIYSDKGLSTTLSANGGGQGAKTGLYKTNNRIRRLTPIECERLQGFPDNFTAGVSDTQRYKQMGNTITVNVIQAIFKNLLK